MTALWRGRFAARLDSKGRLNLPAGIAGSSHRNLKLFITNNIFRGQKFLDVYPEKEWLKLEAKLSSMPAFHLDVQAFRRFYISSAVPVESDSQGRILIPQEHRDYADFSEDLVVVGAHNHLEIWGRSSWKKFHDLVSGNFDQIQAQIAAFESEKKR